MVYLCNRLCQLGHESCVRAVEIEIELHLPVLHLNNLNEIYARFAYLALSTKGPPERLHNSCNETWNEKICSPAIMSTSTRFEAVQNGNGTVMIEI